MILRKPLIFKERRGWRGFEDGFIKDLYKTPYKIISLYILY